MRKQDIRTGIVYAFRNSSYGPVRPLVFLSTDMHKRPVPARAAWAVPAPERTAGARRSRYGTTAAGYPAAVAYSGDPADLAVATPAMLAEESPAPETPSGRNLGFELIPRLAAILGPWDEWKTAEEARKQAEQESRERAAARRAVQEAKTGKAVAAISRHGIRAYAGRAVLDTSVIITPDEAAKLAVLLDGISPWHDTMDAGVRRRDGQ